MNDFPYRYLGVLMMPTDDCNMNCVYCFNSRRKLRTGKRMSEETLRKTFECVIPYYPRIRFIWHGGEPLVMGRAFYERVVALQSSINRHGADIENSVQTNLTLLNDDTARFLVDNRFHVGSSFDGFCANDLTRGRARDILAGSDLLRRAGGRNGFICVVQRRNIDHLLEDYETFKRRRVNYTLNPYLTAPPYDQDPLFVPAEEFVQKVCALYDHWMADAQGGASIGYFLQFLDYILLGRKDLCVYTSCLGKHIGVHWDGTLYACNRDFPEAYCFGNVWDYTDIRDCFESDGFQALLADAVCRRNACKQSCRLFPFCAGGCNSTALAGGSVRMANSYACQILTGVYDHIARSVEPWKDRPEAHIRASLNPELAERLIKSRTAGKVEPEHAPAAPVAE